ncbi:MAG: four helix bundle protein [Candidatus Zambryskibacteria bacterium]|nr:four helix bundle protein [Candidatus Zambryskibacteria bacterium]
MATGLENLKIYQMAKKLELEVFKLLKSFPKEECFRSVDQLSHSSSSVTNNIAEAYNKKSIKDKTRILNDIVKGEANETRSNLEVCIEKGFHSEKSLINGYTELLMALSGYIRFLRNSETQTSKLTNL